MPWCSAQRLRVAEWQHAPVPSPSHETPNGATDAIPRSVLYVPGANARALEKARDLAADALILDLEDAVAPDAKTAAREQVCAAVRRRQFGDGRAAIRINAPGTPWFADDVTAAAAAAPSAVVVPKVQNPAQLRAVDAALDAAGTFANVAIWAMIETAAGVLAAADIAAHSPRLGLLVIGTNDLAAELGAAHVPGRAPLLAALGHCVLAARAAGVGIIDGVFNDIADEAGFVAECRQGRDHGFDGKTLIHPSQIEPCNAAWTPTDDEVEDARSLIGAFEQAGAGGSAVALHRGRMVEAMHVSAARRLLARTSAAPD